MFLDWRLRLFFVSIIVCLYMMIHSLISVTRMDAKTLAERRIHSADMTEFSGRMLGGQFDRRLIVRRNQERRRHEVKINWCKPLGLKAAPGPVTALASFPGSGNTWVRYLLQQVTGIRRGRVTGVSGIAMGIAGVETGSVYKDLALLKNGFPAESVANGSVIAVKTHEWGAAGRQQFDAAILLVRDPFASILAEFNRRSGGHIGHASQEKFSRDKGRFWQDFVITKARDWEAMNSDWINNFQGPLLVISYSDLMDRVEEQLRRTLDFLSVTVTKEEMECAMSRKEGIYRRQKKTMKTNGPVFDNHLTKVVNQRKERVINLIREKLT